MGLFLACESLVGVEPDLGIFLFLGLLEEFGRMVRERLVE